jgi:Tfp pilus assembly protein PilN
MIRINLLPPELRIQKKEERMKLALPGLEIRYVLYAIPAVIGIFLFLHIILAVIGLVQAMQYRSLSHSWKKLEPQRKTVDVLRKQRDAFLADANVTQRLLARRVPWADKLNKLCLLLPSGIWFEELNFSQEGNFALYGSVISLKKDEMALINKFIENLKNDPMFVKDFSGLILDSVKRRTVGGYDVVDFSLKGMVSVK